MRKLLHPKCLCECHQIGSSIMHDFPCCNYCYEKYIDKDGDVDLSLYNDCIRDPCMFDKKKPKLPYIDGGEFVVKRKYDYDSSKIKDKRK